MNPALKTYDLRGHLKHFGDATNMYRSEDFAQPRALVPGDILAGGIILIEPVLEQGGGGVLLRFDDGSRRSVAARIPLQLNSGRPVTMPGDLRVGNVLETGCVVLSNPDTYYSQVSGELMVGLHLSDSVKGDWVPTPADLAIAVLTEMWPAISSSKIGKYALRKIFILSAEARSQLQELSS